LVSGKTEPDANRLSIPLLKNNVLGTNEPYFYVGGFSYIGGFLLVDRVVKFELQFLLAVYFLFILPPIKIKIILVL